MGLFKSIGHALTNNPIADVIKHPSHLPIVGSFFGETPEQEALKKQIANLEGVYAAYRPQAAQARMQGLSQQLGAFSPVNSMLGAVNGMGPGQQFFDTAPLMQNPVDPSAGAARPPVGASSDFAMHPGGAAGLPVAPRRV